MSRLFNSHIEAYYDAASREFKTHFIANNRGVVAHLTFKEITSGVLIKRTRVACALVVEVSCVDYRINFDVDMMLRSAVNSLELAVRSVDGQNLFTLIAKQSIGHTVKHNHSDQSVTIARDIMDISSELVIDMQRTEAFKELIK